MHGKGFWFQIVWVVVLSLLATACGGVTPEADWQTSPLETDTQVPPLAQPSLPPAPTFTAPVVPTSTATSTPRPMPASAQLVVLHTNDNWGEVDPCG